MKGSALLSIEIWSDEKEQDFGIKLSSDSRFRAVTRNNANFVKIVHSSPYFEGFRDMWEFALLNWVRLWQQRRKKGTAAEIQKPGVD